MGKVTATLTLESNDVWLTSVKIKKSATEQANGESDLQTIIIPGSGTKTIFGPSQAADAHDTVYFYVAAYDTNKGLLKVSYGIDGVENAPMSILRPGDFIWMPLHVNKQGVQLTVDNTDVTTAKLDILYSYRG